MTLKLRALMLEMTADANPNIRWHSCWLEVIDPNVPLATPRWTACVPSFRLMRDAITGDVSSAQGAGECVLNWIRKVESGDVEHAEVDGNAWVMHLKKDKVWFEGLYEQGEGGEVSFSQFKLAVQTYVQFLADPEHRTIEVKFPAN